MFTTSYQLPQRRSNKACGSRPQNISQKNFERGGKTYLFPSTPPRWESQPSPPVDMKNFFSSPLVFKATKKAITDLTAFLLSPGTNNSSKHIRIHQARKVDEIIDHILSCATKLQQPAG